MFCGNLLILFLLSNQKDFELIILNRWQHGWIFQRFLNRGAPITPVCFSSPYRILINTLQISLFRVSGYILMINLSTKFFSNSSVLQFSVFIFTLFPFSFRFLLKPRKKSYGYSPGLYHLSFFKIK